MPQLDNLSGKTFSFLTVGDEYKSYKGAAQWRCTCVCGRIVWAPAAGLKNGNAKSCGCTKEISTAGYKVPSFRVYGLYKRRALRRDLAFELTREQFNELIRQNCTYCGVKPSTLLAAPHGGVCQNFSYNGVDRKDNLLGYTVENSVACCKICNRAKSDFSYDEFIAWLDRIVTFRHSQQSHEEVVLCGMADKTAS